MAAAEVSLLWEMVVDRASQTVYIDGEPYDVDLSNTEFALLCALAREPDRVYERAELLRDVWGWQHAADAKTRTLDSHACRLRSKLPPGYVHNVWGKGYRLVPAGHASTVKLTANLSEVSGLQERAEALAKQARELAAHAASFAAALDAERVYAIEAITAYGVASKISDAAGMALIVADRVV